MKIKQSMEDLGKKAKALEKENTTLKLKEKKLKESIELNHLLIKDITDIIARLSSDGTILYVSPAVCSVLGYESRELIGSNGFDPLIHPDDLPKVQSKIMKALEKEHRYNRVEYRMLRKAGDYIWVESTGRLRPTDNNKSFEIISVTREINERKQLEKALKKSYDELENKVKARTIELEKKNEELSTKTKELKNFNEALNVLLQKREKDKIRLEENVLSNVKYSVSPYIQRLKKNSLKDDHKDILNIIEKNLNDIVSPMIQKLSVSFYNLTPREIQTSNLIKIGKTTKEIADIQRLSTRTVEFHRDNLRKKLGLKNKKTNLRTYLLSMK